MVTVVLSNDVVGEHPLVAWFQIMGGGPMAKGPREKAATFS